MAAKGGEISRLQSWKEGIPDPRLLDHTASRNRSNEMLAQDLAKIGFHVLPDQRVLAHFFVCGFMYHTGATGKQFFNVEFDEKEQRPKKSATGFQPIQRKGKKHHFGDARVLKSPKWNSSYRSCLLGTFFVCLSRST